jgi:hypothetical protein
VRVPLVEGAKQRVVLEPPRLLLGEGAERASPAAAAAELDIAEALERSPQGRLLHPADAGVLDL